MLQWSLQVEVLLVFKKHTEGDINVAAVCSCHCEKENYIMGNRSSCSHLVTPRAQAYISFWHQRVPKNHWHWISFSFISFSVKIKIKGISSLIPGGLLIATFTFFIFIVTVCSVFPATLPNRCCQILFIVLYELKGQKEHKTVKLEEDQFNVPFWGF